MLEGPYPRPPRPALQSARRSDWLDGEFSAGDLVMINVLRRPTARNMLGEFPRLDAYVARGEARPAFKRAYAAQHEVFVAASGEPIAL